MGFEFGFRPNYFGFWVPLSGYWLLRMNLLIFFTTLISVSLADDRLFQYSEVDTCENVKKYTILEYQDLCFEEIIVKFEDSLGTTNYVGLNKENVASRMIKLCGAAEKTVTDTTGEPFFNTKKSF